MAAMVEMDDLARLYFRSFVLYRTIGCTWQQHVFVIERDGVLPTGVGTDGHDATNRPASRRQRLPRDGGGPGGCPAEKRQKKKFFLLDRAARCGFLYYRIIYRCIGEDVSESIAKPRVAGHRLVQ